MKDYLKKIVKNGKFTKAIKLFLIAFTLIIAIDAINLPSSLIKRFNLMFLIVVIVGFFTLRAIFLTENHFCDILKEKAINEFDSYLLLSIVGSIIYILFLATTPLFKCYKLIAICSILLLLLLLFKYRINLVRVKNSNKLKNNTNIYDLKDFIENDITIENEYPILFAEKDVDYDLCDRSAIINQLYSSLQACRSSEYSFVIGLEGPWGSGKTTIINNVIEKILQESDEYIIINDFDPWIYSSQLIGTSTGTNGYVYYINENSLKSFFTDENVLSDYLQLCPPSDEIEKFIYDIFNKYKKDEVDKMGEKAIYVDHYIRLW